VGFGDKGIGVLFLSIAVCDAAGIVGIGSPAPFVDVAVIVSVCIMIAFISVAIVIGVDFTAPVDLSGSIISQSSSSWHIHL